MLHKLLLSAGGALALGGAGLLTLSELFVPEELAAMNYGERKKRVIEAINALGPTNDVELPHAGDPEFDARVGAHVEATGADPSQATLRCTLAALESPSSDARALATDTGFPTDAPEARRKWLKTMSDRLWGRS